MLLVVSVVSACDAQGDSPATSSRGNSGSGQVPHLDGVDTIDATDVDTTFLGHSYIATVRALIADLKSLLESGRAPGGRTGLEEVSEPAGRYWRLS